MKFQYFLAERFFKSKKKGFLSFISTISVIGITVGVFALIVVLSVMNGFSTDLREKILGTRAHITIGSMFGDIRDRNGIVSDVSTIPGITGVSPVSSSEIMIKSGDSVTGGIIFGIDPSTIDQVTDLSKHVLAGDLTHLKKGDVIIGSELAFNLSMTIGGSLTVISPNVKVAPNGSLIPKTVKLNVVGIIKTGMYDFDKSFLYTTLEDFSGLFDMAENSCTSIYVKVKDIYDTKNYIEQIIPVLPSTLYARDWIDMNHNLFTALKTEKFVLGLILFMIILVAGINVINTIIMLVQEKRREIGILRSLGVREEGIIRVFLLQGVYIGGLGTSLGAVLGVIACALIKYLGIRIPGGGSVYYIDVLPVEFRFFPDFILTIVFAMVISVIFSYIPAKWAGKIDPIKAIRHE
ncbi:ABC transporter permease [bacterium]|nr:ABC transporter permease [bacterium]